VLFTGEYVHAIDAKQRLAVPALIRSRMDRANLSPAFYAVPGPDRSIWLWPEQTFERLAASLEPSLLPGESTTAFDEVTFPAARLVEIDSAGRIRIPEDLFAESGLESTVVILGLRDHLELRDPAAWTRDKAERRARQHEIILRAREAMLHQQRRSRDDHSTGGGGERGRSSGNG